MPQLLNIPELENLANEFEYLGKMLKYLCFAHDRLDIKCWWLRFTTMENIILNRF